MIESYNKIKKFLYLIFFLILAITFFTRNNFRSPDMINPDVLNEPVQTETENQDIIQFTKDDYEYKLTPLYDYEINGLVVHKMDYTWFSIYKTDSVFPLDLCMIWGENVENKIYKNKSLKFSQDMRFCFAKWQGQIDFNNNQISNNHLVIQDEKIEKELKKISTGDQVKIKGQLVDIEAKNLGKPGKYDPEYIEWKSSTTREDVGSGACEVIYLSDIEILQKGNSLPHYLFKISFYVLIFLVVIDFFLFFKKPTGYKSYD
ncbi:hypothetical protein ES702_00900 [subsurface metagenome]